MIEDDVYNPRAASSGKAKPARRRESDITADCLSWTSAQPLMFARKRHTGAMGTAGHPDVEGCARGHCFQIEMKRPGEKPSAQQMERLRQWRDAGATVGWATSLKEFQAIVDRAGTGWVNPLTGPGVR